MNVRRKSLITSLAAIGCFGAGTALADAPTVGIESPTGIIYLSPGDLPYTVPVVSLLTHSELKNLNVFDVLVNGNSILQDGQPVGNPFTNANACSSNLTGNSAVASCSTYVADATLAANQARVGVNWQIGDFGSYSLSVSVKHQGATGEEEETVQVMTLSVEYPAPPAIANAYINGDDYLSSLAGRRRGCVISKIAENHAKDSKYGQKGGDPVLYPATGYDVVTIQADVNYYFSAVCLK